MHGLYSNETPPQRITILLADACSLVRQELRPILQSRSNFVLVGEARSGQAAVKMAIKLRPALILIDARMPVLSGLQATGQILQTLPETKVLILSALKEEAYIVKAVESGAMGYLLKQTCADDLCWAIQEVHAGKAVFSPAIPRHLQQRARKSLHDRLLA